MSQIGREPDPEIVAHARRLVAAGANRETILVFLRDKKLDKIDSIKTMRALYGLTMPEVKDLVDHSDAWSDRFYSDMALRETAWRALRAIADSQDPRLPKIVIESDSEKSGSSETKS